MRGTVTEKGQHRRHHAPHGTETVLFDDTEQEGADTLVPARGRGRYGLESAYPDEREGKTRESYWRNPQGIDAGVGLLQPGAAGQGSGATRRGRAAWDRALRP